MPKRKYARLGENVSKYECTNKKCKWQGSMDETKQKRVDEIMKELICPKCGNNQFYGLMP